MMIRSLLLLLASLSAFAVPVRADDISAAAPEIVTGDVDRFFEIYDAADGRPTAAQLQAYIDTGSPGLRHFAEARRTTGARIAEAIAQRPEIYVEARRCADVLPRVRGRLAAALGELARLYPDMRTPAVTIAVGRGRPVAIGGSATGVQVGLEALCAYDILNPDIEDRFVSVLAHEFVHAQQSEALTSLETPTVLQLSLAEGIAEFVGELIAGQVAYGSLRGAVAGREAEIETRFLRIGTARTCRRGSTTAPTTAPAIWAIGSDTGSPRPITTMHPTKTARSAKCWK